MPNGEEELREESVLEPGARHPSYVFREEPPSPPIAGGGLVPSPTMELERQRAEEERMRRRVTEFVGPERPQREAPSPEREESGAIPEEVPPPLERGEEEELEEAPTREEMLREQILAQRQAEQERRAEEERVRQQAVQRQTQETQQMLDYAKIGTSETIFVPPLIWLAQTLNKYFFQNSRLPPPRFVEELSCFTFWFSFLFGWIFTPPFVFIFLLLFVVAILFAFV